MRFSLAGATVLGLILSGCAQPSGGFFPPSDATSAQQSHPSLVLRPHDKVVFHHTGSVGVLTVPSGVAHVTIIAAGAQGKSSENFSPGGQGAIVTGTFAVQPGETLFVEAGMHGGGAGGRGPVSGSRGGNYSAVLHLRHDGSALVLIAAGGGGGAGGGSGSAPGGHGGSAGQIGTNGGEGRGSFHCTSCVGAGATQSAGGLGGVLSNGPASNGLPGEAGFGGDGGRDYSGSLYGGGGGGGGWFGGGGGAGGYSPSGASGGGGGSSYVEPGATNVTFSDGRTGEGEVTISW